jgi:hypothetical protein
MGVDMFIIEFEHLPKVNVHYAFIMCINCVHQSLVYVRESLYINFKFVCALH